MNTKNKIFYTIDRTVIENRELIITSYFKSSETELKVFLLLASKYNLYNLSYNLSNSGIMNYRHSICHPTRKSNWYVTTNTLC